MIFVIFTPFLIFVVTITVLFIDVYCTSKDIENPLGRLWKNVRYRNRLYVCDNHYCKRMFRYYQWNLYKARHSKSKCPHCEARYYMETYFRSDEVKRQESWMNVHQDCPKIGLLETFNLNRTMSKLTKAKREDESMRRFEEYNKIKADLQWIENLQKKKEG